MNIIGSVYTGISNIAYRATAFIAPKVRNCLMTAVLALFALYYLLEYSNINSYLIKTANGKGLFALVMIVLLIIFSADRKTDKVSINKPFMAVYLLFAVLMLIIGAVHPLRDGWMIYAVTMLIFPVFFTAWAGRGDYGLLFDRVASVWTIAGFEYYLLCIICLPPDNVHYFLGRYSGLTRNPNILGMITVSVLACSLYLLMRKKMQVMSVMAAGLSLAIVWLTGSRTSSLANVGILAAFLIMVLREREVLQKDKMAPVVGLCLSVVIAAVGIATAELPAEKFGYTGITELRVITDSDQKFTDDELQELGVDVPTGSISIEDTVLSSLFTVVYAESDEAEFNVAEGETNAEAENDEGSTAGERLVDRDSQYGMTNGRAELWLQVLQQVNLTGHDPQQSFLYYNGEQMEAVHNSVLDFTFICGAPSGVLWLVIELMAAVFAFMFLFGKKEFPEGAGMAVMLIAGYGIESLLEVQILFGNRHIVLLFFIALSMLAVRPVKEESGTTEDAAE